MKALNLVKRASVIGVAALLSACATYSNLPKSELETPTKSEDGSAIAFQAKTGCTNMTLGLAPELEEGKFGEVNVINFMGGGLIIPSRTYFDARGGKTHRYELAPGHYAVASLRCAIGSSVYSTPRKTEVKYGEFDVEAGKTTYIGNITASVNTATKQFIFKVSDDSEEARAYMAEKHPDKVLQVKLMDNILPILSFKEILEKYLKLQEDLEKKAKEKAEE